ncbi:Polyphenol oxidase chloroplastic [Bienertia sinuspersici]
MASFSPSTTTTTITNLSAVSLTPLSISIPSRLWGFRSNHPSRVAPKISCNAANNDSNAKTNKFDRRNMLIGLGGLYGITTMKNSAAAADAAAAATPPVTFPKLLNKVLWTNLPRPVKSRSKKEKEDKEEVLIIEVESKRDVYSKFDVYINDEDEAPTKESRSQTEYAGSFVNVPHKNKRGSEGNVMTTTVKFGLTDLIEDLGADDDEGIDITFVPRTGTDSVVIKAVRIEFLD